MVFCTGHKGLKAIGESSLAKKPVLYPNPAARLIVRLIKELGQSHMGSIDCLDCEHKRWKEGLEEILIDSKDNISLFIIHDSCLTLLSCKHQETPISECFVVTGCLRRQGKPCAILNTTSIEQKKINTLKD